MNRTEAKRYKLYGSRTRILRGPSRDDILGRLQTLPRGDGSLILENLDRPGRYVQVLLQPDGLFRLEVRDDDLLRHLMTRTLMVDRVTDAFEGWMTEVHEPGRTGWRDAFQLQDISAELIDPHQATS